MSKDPSKKRKKHEETEIRKAALNAVKDATIIREAWIAAIEAGAAAAIAVIRNAASEQLVKTVPSDPTLVKMQKKNGKFSEPPAKTAQESPPSA